MRPCGAAAQPSTGLARAIEPSKTKFRRLITAAWIYDSCCNLNRFKGNVSNGSKADITPQGFSLAAVLLEGDCGGT